MRNRPTWPWGGRPRTGGGLRRIIVPLLLIEVLGTALGATASAGRVPPNPGVSMLVSPTRLVLAPDQLSKTQRLQVRNRSRMPLDVSTKVDRTTRTSTRGEPMNPTSTPGRPHRGHTRTAAAAAGLAALLTALAPALAPAAATATAAPQ